MQRKKPTLEKLDCVFIPGVVFDRHGYRIGYGGGYYDRFLPRLAPSTLLVGVAYAWQVVERIPRDAYDEPPPCAGDGKGSSDIFTPNVHETFTPHTSRIGYNVDRHAYLRRSRHKCIIN